MKKRTHCSFPMAFTFSTSSFRRLFSIHAWFSPFLLLISAFVWRTSYRGAVAYSFRVILRRFRSFFSRFRCFFWVVFWRVFVAFVTSFRERFFLSLAKGMTLALSGLKHECYLSKLEIFSHN